MLEGGSLYSLIDSEQHSGVALGPRQRTSGWYGKGARIALSLAKALEYLHRWGVAGAAGEWGEAGGRTGGCLASEAGVLLARSLSCVVAWQGLLSAGLRRDAHACPGLFLLRKRSFEGGLLFSLLQALCHPFRLQGRVGWAW